MAISQDKRVGSFQTNLGKDKLGLMSFSGEEGMSELFEFKITCLSADKGLLNKNELDLDGLMLTECQVALATKHVGVMRHFHGTITHAKFKNYLGHMACYEFTIRPWFWLLKHSRNSRIFNDKTVFEIIDKVFEEYPYLKYNIVSRANRRPMEYCVQYRESDFDFISRLLEENDLYYRFDHSEKQHLMVIATGASDSKPKDGGQPIVYDVSEQAATRSGDYLNQFHPKRAFYVNKFALNEFDYKRPKINLLVNSDEGGPYANNGVEYYDFPSGMVEQADELNRLHELGQTAKQRDQHVSAAGDALTCMPGRMLTLTNHSEKSFNKDFMVRRVIHDFKSDSYESTDNAKESRYEGQYELIASSEFHPPIVTAKPVIPGPQTAFVESEMDSQTRLKVRFHWERDKKLSRYVRIGHAWSGNGWGDFKIPRKGMEVIVEFLNGDPDYPLITGCVYNGEFKPPYDKPQISGVKSRTYGAESGYNEFIFDDTPGAELIRTHAQKDVETTILDSRTEDIGNETKTTAVKKISFICGASSLVMTPTDVTITTPNLNFQVAANMSTTVGVNSTSTIGVNETVTVGVNSTVTTGANYIMTTGANTLMTTGANHLITSGALINMTSGAMFNVQSGALITTLSAGPTIGMGLPYIIGFPSICL